MRAQEFLKELFAPGKKWQWSFTGSEEAVAVFHVGDIPYQFHAYTYSEDPTVWDVEFKNATRGAEQGRTSKFGLTGTGNAAEVMSTIADIMREFLQRYQGSVTTLTFTADEPSRRALYARMAKRLLPTWTLTHTDKEFRLQAPKAVNEDTSGSQSAGCIIVAEDTGRWCLQQRSDTVSDPGVWSTWGGGVEPGESLEQAVRRELEEEGGYTGALTLEPLHSNSQYVTFIGRVPHEFEPRINQESKSWCWADQDQLPEPLHPGLEQALTKLNENLTEALDFEEGDCPIFAIALHRLSKLPLMALVEYNEEIGTTVLIHAYVKFTDGREYPCVDVNGEGNTEWYLQQFPHGGNAEEIQISEKDLLELGYGKSQCPTLQQVLPQAKEVLTDIELTENFADGKKPGRKGLSKRVGIPKKASLSKLQKIASSSTGERRRMAQWQLNMRRGRNKNK